MNLDLSWNDALCVDGTCDSADAETLLAAITPLIPSNIDLLELHLYGLDLDSGSATVAWHAVVRQLRDRHGRVILLEAPQMLAHSLYKVGDLSDGRIQLVQPRSDEGFTVN